MMKINFKTLTDETFSLNNVDPSTKILDIKKQIQPKVDCEVSDILLLHLSKILKNEQTIGECGYKDDGYIVVHKLRTVRPVLPRSKRPNGHISIPQQEDAVEEPSDPFSDRIMKLMELGFERDKCEQALELANNDFETAVFLLSENALGENAQQDDENNVEPNRSKMQIFGEYQPFYNSLSPAEKNAVERLLNYGSPQMVIQYYIACNKNEEDTLNLLAGY